MVYNLLYHLTAIESDILWWNLNQLKPHLSIFNGKKIVTMAKKDKSDPIIEKIKELLSDSEIQYIEFPNYADREVSPFLFKSGPILENQNEDEFTFYAHSKGLARDIQIQNKEAEYKTIQPIVLWTSYMYEWNLKKFDLVETALKSHDACGIFKCNVSWPAPKKGHTSHWHYPGTFWWLRHSEMFKSGSDADGNKIKWADKMPHPYHACGMEIWPGIQQVDTNRAANLFPLPAIFEATNKKGFAGKLYKEEWWIEYLGGRNEYETEFNKRFNI